MAARTKLLVLHAGSSSLKFKVFGVGGAGSGGGPGPAAGAPSLQPIAAGLCECIGDPAGGAVMRVRPLRACHPPTPRLCAC